MQQNTGSSSRFELIREPYSETMLRKTKRRKEACGELGVMYEQKILMLGLYRALKGRYDFILDTNIKEVGAFDDVVFTYKEKDGIQHRIYLQAKHKKEKSKAIYYDDFLKEGNDNYALYKYFIDYIDIIKNFEEIDNKYFIIYTNMDFKCRKEDVRGFRVHKKSDTEYFIFRKLNLSDHKPLNNFFAINSKVSRKVPAFYQFSDRNEKGGDEKTRVIEFLQTEFEDINKKKINEAKKNNKEIDTKEEMLSKLTKSDLKSILERFFDSLVFAIDQFNQASLGNQIKEDIQENHPNSLTEDHVEYIFEHSLKNISQWKLRNAKPLTENDDFFTKGENKFKNFPALYLSSMHENELKASTCKLQKKDFEDVIEFITSGKKLWVISSNPPWFHKLKIYQALTFENHNTYIQNWGINYGNYGNHLFSTWSELLEYTELFMGAFETMEQCLFIITNESKNSVHPETYRIVQKMEKIVSSSASKKIVVISPGNFELSKLLKGKISSFDRNKKLILVPKQPQLYIHS